MPSYEIDTSKEAICRVVETIKDEAVKLLLVQIVQERDDFFQEFWKILEEDSSRRDPLEALQWRIDNCLDVKDRFSSMTATINRAAVQIAELKRELKQTRKAVVFCRLGP